MKKKKEIVSVKIADLKPNPKNEKIHTKANLDLIRDSINMFGYVNYIIVDNDMMILAGHGRYYVMKEMDEYKKIEVIMLSGLADVEKTKFRIFDNQSSNLGHYDDELLIDSIEEILGGDKGFDISSLGIDGLVDAFTIEEFRFDLGIVEKSMVDSKKRMIIIITDDIDGAINTIEAEGLKYILAHERNTK